MSDTQDDQKMEFRHRVADRIRQHRLAVGISQEQLAKAIGMTRTQLSHVEAGRCGLTAVSLVRLGKVLGVGADALTEGCL